MIRNIGMFFRLNNHNIMFFRLTINDIMAVIDQVIRDIGGLL